MPGGRRFRGSRGGAIRPPQRQIFNFGDCSTYDGVAPIVGTVKALGTFGATVTDGALTLVRTRGEITVLQRTEAAADQTWCGAMGMIVVSDDAFAAGVGSVPGPLTDVFDDWVVWVPFGGMSFGGIGPGELFFRKDFDSRGMRKMKFGEVLINVIEIESLVAGGTVDAAVTYRQQYKL